MRINIIEAGANANGLCLETAVIQNAIDSCNEQGGGTVYFPAGLYLTGTLKLRSHVTLHLAHGATLKGSSDIKDYYLGEQLVGMFVANDACGVRLEGSGTLDGSGMSFADMAHARDDAPTPMPERPGNMIVFNNCRDIVMRDLRIHDAPFWTIHINGSHGAMLLDLNIDNPPCVPNNDGIHCSASSEVMIRGCRIHCGDDPIAITGINDHGPLIPGFLGYDKPTRNIIVSDCVMSSRSSGIRVGYGHNDIENCHFSNIIMHDCHRALGVFTRNRGAIRNISFSNITAETRMYDFGWWGHGEIIHVSSIRYTDDDALGAIEDVRFSNIRGRGPNGVVIAGVEEQPLQNILLENVEIEVTPCERFAARGSILDLRPSDLLERGGVLETRLYPLIVSHARDVRIERSRFTVAEDNTFFEHGLSEAHCEGLELERVRF